MLCEHVEGINKKGKNDRNNKSYGTPPEPTAEGVDPLSE